MSIGLFISYRDPRKEDRWIPIANDDVFQRIWRPTCRRLGLGWVARFQSGWTLSPLDLPPILEELRKLRQHLPDSDLPAESLHHLLARISVLRRELTEIERTADARAFIGCLLDHPQRDIGLDALIPPGDQLPPSLTDVLSPVRTRSVPNTPDNPLPGRAASTESFHGPTFNEL